MIEWESHEANGRGEGETFTLIRDGRSLGMVTVSYDQRCFGLGGLGLPISKSDTVQCDPFEGRGWRVSLVQAAKEHLAKAIEL